MPSQKCLAHPETKHQMTTSLLRAIGTDLPDSEAREDCAKKEGLGTPGQGTFSQGGATMGPGVDLQRYLPLASRHWLVIHILCFLPQEKEMLMCTVMDTRVNLSTYFSPRKYQPSSSYVVEEKYPVSITVPFSKKNVAEFPLRRRT